MIQVYGMHTCPDCDAVFEEIAAHPEKYEFIDLAAHVRNLKAFLRLRDKNPLFDECKTRGSIGIPCFVLEDGRVSLDPRDAGLTVREASPACSIEDHRAGRKGC